MLSFFKKLTSPTVLLGLFLTAFLWALLLSWQSGGVRSLLPLVVAAMGVTALALARRMSIHAHEADQSLREGEHYIETAAGLSQDIQAIIDLDSQRYIYMNPAVEQMLGYGPGAFISGGLDLFYSLLHTEDRERVKRGLEQLVSRSATPDPRGNEEIREDAYRIRNAHGEWRWLKSRQQVFKRHADGRPAEIISVAHDVTEHRSAEAALIQAQKYESLGTLARGVAHDINNLLMGIQGFADLAREKMNEPAAAKNNLDKVQESVGRASRLCRQMLAYSGHGRIQVVRHPLNDSVKECLPLVESLIPDGANLELALGNGLPMVEADPSRVRHALINLIVNAAEAIGPGRGGEIGIRTSLKHLGGDGDPAAHGLKGDYVCLEVFDNGSGMTENTLHAVFDPLFSATHPGRGLGLTTVLGIAREHNGAVHVESTPGKGSSVLVYLPIAQREEIDEGDEATPLAGTAGMLLLVDDEPTIRSVLREGFENSGFQVIEAVDGVDAFGAFVRHRSSISAVVLDLTMPRMGGAELFSEIHRLAPEVPVILMSGYTQQEATESLADVGLAGFLSKPCSIKEALAVVNRAMGRASVR